MVRKIMPAQSRKFQTQWTALFLVAAELTSRGYLVNFSLGNAKFTDIQVETPDGQQYSVDAKGQSTKGYWMVRQRKHNKNQYYILVYVPRAKSTKDVLQPKEAQYFILSSEMMDKEMTLNQNSAEQINEKRKIEGKPRLIEMPGIGGLSFEQARKYENQWQNLPQMCP